MQNTIFEPLRWSEQPVRVAIQSTDGKPTAYFQTTSPRDLERICLNRPVEELPRITTLLSPSHHVVSAMALDNLFKVVPPEPAVNMRVALLQALFVAHHLRKLYFLLCAGENPFREFQLRGSAGQQNRLPHRLLDEVMHCVALAQEAATILGGRPDHALSAVAGGVGRALKEPYYERLPEIAAQCLECAVKLVPIFREKVLENGGSAGGFLDLSVKPARTLAMSKDNSHVVVKDAEGNEGDRFEPPRIFEKVSLHREPWTCEPFAYLVDKGWKTFDAESSDSFYFVGALSRLNVGEELDGEKAERERQQLASDWGSSPQFTVKAAFRSLLVELIASAEKMVQLYTQENLVGPSFRTMPSEMGTTGIAALESPKGFIAHRYEVDDQGLVRKIEILDTSAENNAIRCLIARRAFEKSVARNLNHQQTKEMIEASLLPF